MRGPTGDANADAFLREMDQDMAAALQDGRQIAQQIATETLVLIDAATPVKTGHLRLNNQVEVARSADGRFAAEPGDDEIEGVDPSGARAIAAGTAAIVNLKNFADVRFFNNTPYAPYLEFGTDKIAPRAMYARAAAAIEAKYQQVTLDPARGRVGLKGGNA